MTAKKTTKKTTFDRKSNSLSVILFKFKNKNVYLDHDSKCLRLGINGRNYDPMDFIAKVLQTTAERRKFRQALRAGGLHDIVQDTIPPKQMSRKERRRLTELDLRIDDYYHD